MKLQNLITVYTNSTEGSFQIISPRELQNKMNLRSLNDGDFKTMVTRFQNEENYKWLDFGIGNQKFEAPTIKFMMQREIHTIRLFTPDDSEKPIGIVSLSDINKSS